MYSDVITFFVAKQGNVRKSKKFMKIVNIDGENLHALIKTLSNFNEIFRKDVPYDYIKSIKNVGFTLSLEVTFLEKRISF